MSTRLSTQLHRSLFALPLLAIGLLAVDPTENAAAAGAGGSATTIAFAGDVTCKSPAAPAEPATVLAARLPGDIGLLAARVRCAP